MKFLVLGCNGMLGHVVSLYLKEKGHNVTGLAHAQHELLVGTCTSVTNDGVVPVDCACGCGTPFFAS